MRGFIGVITYAETCNAVKVFSLFPVRKQEGNRHACRAMESMDRLLMTLIARAVLYRKFHDKLETYSNVEVGAKKL